MTDPTIRELGRYTRRDMLKISAAAGVAGLLGGALLDEALRQKRLHRISHTRTGLGTLISITVVDEDATSAEASVTAAFAQVERLEAILSRHRPNTPVSQLNRVGHLEAAPQELLDVLTEAEATARLTDGAFDVTMAPLLALYEERYGRGRVPTSVEIRTAQSLVDHSALRVDGEAVVLDRAGMAITLDGAAKGYVVDRVVEGLAAAGYERVLVDAGGDIGSAGALSAEWKIAVQDPEDARKSLDVVPLPNGACIATSGDYMQNFTEDRSAHPIIDPRTGYSPRLASSASVIAPSVLRADALSTAALVLGPVQGCAVLESLRDTEGLIVAKDGTCHATTGWSVA